MKKPFAFNANASTQVPTPTTIADVERVDASKRLWRYSDVQRGAARRLVQEAIDAMSTQFPDGKKLRKWEGILNRL